MRYPGISRELAKKWISEGRIATLFDGLDEVDDHRRKSVVEALNQTYLSQHPQQPVVVCSRINEYLPLQALKETRLQLAGAITLQPLDERQITAYLNAAYAEHLSEAIRDDAALQEMARTPLTLSMMTLAYSAKESLNVDTERTLVQRRHDLMEAYVKQMLQRKARRERGIPFDENTDNDIPVSKFDYTPDRINRYLGWLAVRMSTRMQTAFSPDQFYSFLKQDLDKDQHDGIFWSLTLARGIVAFALVLLTGLMLVPSTLEAHLTVIGLGFVSWIGSCLPAWINRNSEGKELAVGLITGAVSVTWFAGVAAVGTSAVLPLPIPAIPLGILMIALVAATSISVSLVNRIDKSDGYLLVSILVSICLAMLLRTFDFEFAQSWHLTAVIVFILPSILLSVDSEISFGERVKVFLLILCLSVLPFAIGSWLVGELTWFDVLLSVTIISALIVGIGYQTLYLTGLSLLGVLLGSHLAGPAGAVVALLLVWSIWLLWREAPFKLRYKLLQMKLKTNFHGWLERIENRFIFNTSSHGIFALRWQLPLRFRRFVNFAESAFLLKRSALDIEFVHRMLRDYYALRELQPRLNDKKMANRLDAIRSLGYQGDSAVDALAEFFQAEHSSTREASVWAMGRIASPSVIPYLEIALQDREAKVKITALREIMRCQPEKAGYILAMLTELENDQDILQAIILEFLMLYKVSDMSSICDVQIDFKAKPEHRLRPIVTRVKNGHLIKTTKLLFAKLEQRIQLQDYLVSLIRNGKTQRVRHGAICLSAYFQPQSLSPVLIKILKNRKDKNLKLVIDLLGVLDDKRSVKPLMELYRSLNSTAFIKFDKRQDLLTHIRFAVRKLAPDLAKTELGPAMSTRPGLIKRLFSRRIH